MEGASTAVITRNIKDGTLKYPATLDFIYNQADRIENRYTVRGEGESYTTAEEDEPPIPPLFTLPFAPREESMKDELPINDESGPPISSSGIYSANIPLT